MKLQRIGAILGVMAAVSGSGCWGAESAAPAPEKDRQALAQEVQAMAKSAQAFSDIFVKTIDLTLPSVVSITTTRTVRVPLPSGDMPMPFPFEGQPPNRPQRPNERDRKYEASNLASGFVVDAEKGYVVTNAHVVRDVKAANIRVVFQDGREVTPEKVILDLRTDLAVIKIKPDHLVALQWADQAEVKRGQWVIALGSPRGFGGSATSGIISAPSTRHRFFANREPGEFRTKLDPYAVEDYIQTDAAINMGNSGGPLISLDGKVLGINTLIVSETMSSSGLAFAVPTRLARPAVESLIENGRVVRGHLGVAIIEPARIDDDAAMSLFKMDKAEQVFAKYHIKREDKGCVVEQMMPGGPADKAGIQTGDVIRAVAGAPTPDVDTLRDLIAATKPGAEVEIAVMRMGHEKKIKAVIGEQPAGEKGWASAGESSTADDVGVSIQPMTPELAEALGFAADLKGLIVTDVAPDGPAAKAKPSAVQRNDVILEVNKTPVKNFEEFDAAVQKAKSGNIALLVRRGEANQLISLKLSK